MRTTRRSGGVKFDFSEYSGIFIYLFICNISTGHPIQRRLVSMGACKQLNIKMFDLCLGRALIVCYPIFLLTRRLSPALRINPAVNPFRLPFGQ